MPQGRWATTNQKPYLGLGGDMSSVWNFCLGGDMSSVWNVCLGGDMSSVWNVSFQVISRGNQWQRHEISAVFKALASASLTTNIIS